MTDTYTLGPISAGSDSFLGGLFGFAQGISQNFALGQEVYVNNPALGNAIITGQATSANLSSAGVQAVIAATAKPRSDNPILAIGQDIGSLFGAGFQGLGSIVGTAGNTAGPGIAGGASAGTGGVLNAITSGIGGAAAGALPGIAGGLENALGLPGGSGASIVLLIAGGLALFILFLLLK